MNKIKILMSCIAIITLTLGFSPQISKAETAVVTMDSRLVNKIPRDFSNYPPARIYYQSGGYGGYIDLQTAEKITNGYRGYYGGEIYPICVGGACP
ncbi:hypothetical protein [Sutcliffiella rhizosphaerae]|uniref:Uncharacterized protein n=1 Tax=Sutcliffiella rhizosphaerae TaxID=2880967 RepID=A0ABN8AFA0_9BACI|nr:hypothetical protein [Sutcliffiella rhizosphaerae]CAG9622787.1 hypothetical protein BACCIP111883_03578 [Sutcliffiella rhizosphaerae]